MKFVFNPFTNKLDSTDSGAAGSGILTLNTLSPAVGGDFTLTAGSGVTLTPGTNAITIAASGTGVSTLTGNSGGAVSGTNINTVGSGSITVVGNPGTSTTTAQLTGITNHAIQVGAGTTTLTQIGPSATAGQIFQSAGSSADPAFSTATYPSTGTGTGTILRADGTNWVSTTATYPATTSASQLLYSSSANVVGGLTTANNGTLVTSSSGVPSILAGPGTTGNILQSNAAAAPSYSTATYPSTAGTLGNVLTSDGTNWTSTAPAAGGIATISGDTGSITGSTVSIKAGNATNVSGSSVKFVNSGTASVLNVTDGTSNTFIGQGTGLTTVSGSNNSGFGAFSFGHITSGFSNSGFGAQTLGSLTTGSNNLAVGSSLLGALTTGSSNVVIGSSSGTNYISSESSNILIGYTITGTGGESNVLRIGKATGTAGGNLNSAFIQGISGITVTGATVLCSTAGQLGTISSSRKYKENITDLDDSSILGLRPVKFNYISDETKAPVYGLIAEEVEEKFPDLVLYRDGQPDSIKYHEMPALLLAEIQKLNKRIEALEAK